MRFATSVSPSNRSTTLSITVNTSSPSTGFSVTAAVPPEFAFSIVCCSILAFHFILYR
jgi:hypothetical protein